MLITRSHAPRGNAVLAAPRPSVGGQTRTDAGFVGWVGPPSFQPRKHPGGRSPPYNVTRPPGLRVRTGTMRSVEDGISTGDRRDEGGRGSRQEVGHAGRAKSAAGVFPASQSDG